jgi:hypothetical protein
MENMEYKGKLINMEYKGQLIEYKPKIENTNEKL